MTLKYKKNRERVTLVKKDKQTWMAFERTGNLFISNYLATGVSRHNAYRRGLRQLLRQDEMPVGKIGLCREYLFGK